jgi:dihydrofolate reductase
VFVLTHYPRPPLTMEGGTTFTFVDGSEEALGRAFDAAGGGDVRVGGGAATVQQYLRAGLVDELHVAIVPIFLGGGERLFDGIGHALGDYECAELVASPNVAHIRLTRH